MKRRKYVQVLLVLLGLTLPVKYARTQVLPVEVVFGHQNYYYQHALNKRLSDGSPLGFFHTSSILIPYDEDRTKEIMSQSYITYRISTPISAGIGTIYVPVTRFRPSIFLQFFQRGKRTTLLVFPRADLWKNPSFELMGFMEYQPAINDKIKLYTRVQLMTTWTRKEHSRSYQYLRLGIHLSKLQIGAAIQFDEYGKAGKAYSNYGGFIRHLF